MSHELLPSTILLCLTYPENPYVDDYDIAEHERHVLNEARRLAGRFGAKLELLVVLEQYHYEYTEAQAELEGERQRRTRQALDTLCAQVRADGVACEAHIDSGLAWYQILKHATALSADWIMVSATRSGALASDNTALGSTARRVVRKARQPVLVVRSTETKPIRHVGVAVDLSEISGRLASAGAALSEALGASCSLVNAVDYRGEYAFARVPGAAQKRDEYRQLVRDRALAGMAALVPEGASWERVVLEQDIAVGLPAWVERASVDLVVMGSLSRSGIAGLVIGNSAEKLLNRLTCSLLVLKPDGWSPEG